MGNGRDTALPERSETGRETGSNTHTARRAARGRKVAARLALDAGDGVTRHVMVGFSDPADGQAEAAAISEAAATAGRAAATTTGPLRSSMAARLTGRALARPGRAPACEPARKRGNSTLTGAPVNRTDWPALFPSDSRISSECAERPAGLCCVGGANRPVAEPAGEFFSAPPIPRYSVVAAPSFFPPKRGPHLREKTPYLDPPGGL